jgi:hypothetical protein
LTAPGTGLGFWKGLMVGSSLDSILPSWGVVADESKAPGGGAGRSFVSKETTRGAGGFFCSPGTASCTAGVVVPFVVVCESDP